MKRYYRRPGGEISRSFNFFRDKSQTYPPTRDYNHEIGEIDLIFSEKYPFLLYEIYIFP